ncbi:hypothetical protein Sango_0015100 [Sesamum angolense]|uniref:RNase H type-1 domain-containing protein n=1 Tax=Sesamum angolense TaxID=2727404 RepID=A0AAE1XCH5_9LAMI|nr:hypothetical protein Sango_0015100 [Sesamum angolense]
MVTQKRIEANSLKIKAILDMKAPTNTDEVQRLTRRITVLSRFISKAAKRSLPFLQSTEKSKEFRVGYLLEASIRRTQEVSSRTALLEKKNMPLKQILGKPYTSGQLVKLTVELSEAPVEEAPKVKKWLLHVDGSSTIQGSGAGVVITSPYGEDLEFAVKFDFKASNNKTEYETLIIGMRMTHEVGARPLVAYANSQLIVKQVEGTYETKEENIIHYLQHITELKIEFKNSS